jgi:hypothetical protein
VLAKMKWIYLLLDVDLWEAPGLLSAHRWVQDLQLAKVGWSGLLQGTMEILSGLLQAGFIS